MTNRTRLLLRFGCYCAANFAANYHQSIIGFIVFYGDASFVRSDVLIWNVIQTMIIIPTATHRSDKMLPFLWSPSSQLHCFHCFPYNRCCPLRADVIRWWLYCLACIETCQRKRNDSICIALLCLRLVAHHITWLVWPDLRAILPQHCGLTPNDAAKIRFSTIRPRTRDWFNLVIMWWDTCASHFEAPIYQEWHTFGSEFRVQSHWINP